MKVLFAAVLMALSVASSGWTQTKVSLAQLAAYYRPDREKVLYTGAKAEGKIMWYTSLAGASYKELANAFEAKYPGVKVETYRGTRQELGARIMAEAQANRPGLEILEAAMRNATPIIEVKPRRVGGATYQVPVEIRGDRRLSLGVRWLVQAARKRNGKSMSEKLAAEFVDAMNGLGAAVKRREDTHKMAEANRAFSHFKW